MVSPDAQPPTKRELYKRAQELGVERPSRMDKAALADAVARKETERLVGEVVWATAQREVQSAAQQAQDAVRTTVQQEVQSAMQQVRGAVRSIAQPVARQVRETTREVVRQQVQSAAQQAQDAMREVIRQEVQSAERQVREVVQSAAQDSSQTTVQPRRADRREIARLQQAPAGLWKTVVVPIVVALLTSLATAMLANDYYTSRMADFALRRGDSPYQLR